MDAQVAKRYLVKEMIKASGFEPHRKYLGMSQIGFCPLDVYRKLTRGRYGEMGEDSARRYLRGSLFEAEAIRRLTDAGIYRPDSRHQVVADFDGRFLGHTDGDTVDGDLIEIKSCRQEDFEWIEGNHKPLPYHFAQIQMYIRYGNYRHALAVYVSTETYKYFILDIYPASRVQDAMIARAKSILAAYDGGPLPECTCGRCMESRPAQVREVAHAG